MLSIIKLKKKDNNTKEIYDKGYIVGKTRYYPPSIQEWKDSIYSFNKNTTKLIPVANYYIHNLIKSYFNMFSKKLEKRIKLLRIRKKKRRIIGRNIWISKPDIKHSSDKILINLYLYNRQYAFFLKKIKKLKLFWGKRLGIKIVQKWKERNIFYKTQNIFYKDKFFKLLNKSYYKRWLFNNKIIYFLIYKRKDILNYFNTLESREKFLINKPIFWKIIFNKILTYINIYRYILKKNFFLINLIKASNFRFLKKMFRYQLLLIKYRQAILFNKLKFKDAYLVPIINLLSKIYRKKIEINLISLKKFNHDSNILAQIAISKISNRKNKPLKVVKTSVRKSKVYKFNKGLLKQQDFNFSERQNYILKDFYENVNNVDKINNILNKELNPGNNLNLHKIVLSSVNNKVIAGIKVQVSGRITRRLIAQRAKCKVIYKGTLKNIDSAYKGISTVILKGHEKSSVQYSYLTSKRRIGAFGLKGWINTY